MIHLFDKIYLKFSEFTEESGLAVVISKDGNLPISELVQNGSILFYFQDYFELVGEQAMFTEFTDFLQFLKDKRQTISIYADQEAFPRIFVEFFSTILQHPTHEELLNLYRSYLFKFNFMHKGFHSKDEFSYEKYLPKLDIWNKIPLNLRDDHNLKFVSQLSEKLGVEFLLASYLCNGAYKNSLKESIRPLLRKDLEKYLYELKEIILVHLLHRPFIEQFKLSQDYNLENFEEIIEEKSPLIQVFFEKSIWIRPEMRAQSSSKNIRFENINEGHIQAMSAFSKIAGCIWSEESCYQFTKSDINKLQFIPFLQNLDDEGLSKIIEVESAFINAAGCFFSIDLVTVNHYLIHTILDRYNNKDLGYLKRFTLKGPCLP